MSKVVMVLTTWPDQAGAERVARAVVESGLAACVNILPPMTSVYRWRGDTHIGAELQLVMKTSAQRVSDLQKFLLGEHPYELPEILCVGVDQGLPAYLNWVIENSDD